MAHRGLPGEIGLDIAEQRDCLAGEIGVDPDRAVRGRKDQILRVARLGHGQHQHEDEKPAQHHHTDSPKPMTAIEKGSAGVRNSESPKRIATPSTISASRARNWSPRRYWPAEAPNCAPAT